jgi:hypothetical protein
VLLSADPIRAIITSDELILFVPPGGDTVMEILQKYMVDWISMKPKIPYEIHAYESMLSTLSILLNEEKRRLQLEAKAVIEVTKKVALLKVEAQVSISCLLS